MPVMLRHIDAIAREKQRDVLYLEFHPEGREERRGYRYGDDPVRAAILAWLDEQGFRWERCGPYADIRIIEETYRGLIYIDIAFDEKNEQYRRLAAYLEYPDGTIRQPSVRFYINSLEHAMKNAEHDQPGFWESLNW